MDAAGRKEFWDVLCSLNTYDYESIEKLVAAAPVPQELCRFRAVSENTLLQLQNNEQFFSTANYYDDPFDSYFSIDFHALQNNCYGVKRMLEQGDAERIKRFLTEYDLGEDADAIMHLLKTTSFDMNWLKLSLQDVRDLIQKQINSICFCEDAMNETMWLKYADQHKGFVQVYDCYDPSTILCGMEPKCAECGVNRFRPRLLPVYYGNQMYDATSYALNVLARELLKEKLSLLPQKIQDAMSCNAAWQTERIALIKKECHHYDQEWRMILPTPYTNRPRIRMKPKSVLIGLRTPEYQKRLIISAAHIAGIREIYQVFINDRNVLDKKCIAED